MAFNKENKVTYTELSPSLQALIDGKLNITEFNTHINDNVHHITQQERDYWNSISAADRAFTSKAISDALGDFSTLGKDITSILNTKADKSELQQLKDSLARVAFTGSYTDLVDKPSSLAFSDHANSCDTATNATNAINAQHALNADYATNAGDAATVSGGIRITIGGNPPANPQNNKELWFDGSFTKFYMNNGWVITGAALK